MAKISQRPQSSAPLWGGVRGGGGAIHASTPPHPALSCPGRVQRAPFREPNEFRDPAQDVRSAICVPAKTHHVAPRSRLIARFRSLGRDTRAPCPTARSQRALPARSRRSCSVSCGSGCPSTTSRHLPSACFSLVNPGGRASPSARQRFHPAKESLGMSGASVSKHEARSVAAPSFETRRYATPSG
jgi:hypothetical protein